MLLLAPVWVSGPASDYPFSPAGVSMSVCTWMALPPSRSAPSSPLHLEDAIWRGEFKGQGTRAGGWRRTGEIPEVACGGLGQGPRTIFKSWGGGGCEARRGEGTGTGKGEWEERIFLHLQDRVLLLSGSSHQASLYSCLNYSLPLPPPAGQGRVAEPLQAPAL